MLVVRKDRRCRRDPHRKQPRLGGSDAVRGLRRNVDRARRGWGRRRRPRSDRRSCRVRGRPPLQRRRRLAADGSRLNSTIAIVLPNTGAAATRRDRLADGFEVSNDWVRPEDPSSWASAVRPGSRTATRRLTSRVERPSSWPADRPGRGGDRRRAPAGSPRSTARSRAGSRSSAQAPTPRRTASTSTTRTRINRMPGVWPTSVLSPRNTRRAPRTRRARRSWRRATRAQDPHERGSRPAIAARRRRRP